MMSSTLQTALFTGSETLESLTEKYAIKVKAHPRFPNLVQLKYDQINSPMGNELVQQCRGIILDTTSQFEIVARPFDKFFNQGEPHAKSIDWSTARVQEKLDGSLMIVYFYAGEWHVASSGTPDAGGQVHASGSTFQDLFWSTWLEKNYSVTNLNPCYTYMFELMTKHNRVVVAHAEPRLVLIGVRDTLTGVEHDLGKFSGVFECVRQFPLRSPEEIEASFKNFSGLEQEGYVVVDHWFSRIKIKHPTYLVAHHMIGGLSAKKLLEIVRGGETSEILAYFPEWEAEAEVVRKKYGDLIAEAVAEYQAISDNLTQKEFALAIKDSRYKAAMFALRANKTSSFKQYYNAVRLETLAGLLGIEEGS